MTKVLCNVLQVPVNGWDVDGSTEPVLIREG